MRKSIGVILSLIYLSTCLLFGCGTNQNEVVPEAGQLRVEATKDSQNDTLKATDDVNTAKEAFREETASVKVKMGSVVLAFHVDETKARTQKATNGSYAYEFLSDEEKLWYVDIYSTLDDMASDEVELNRGGTDAVGEAGIDRIFQCVLNDHPELFYVDGYTYTKYSTGGKNVRITFNGTYIMDAVERTNRQVQIDSYVSECLAGISTSATDYEKVKYVYEYIISHTDYDLNAIDNQNICSVFIGHASVCQGYAKATQYLLERLDIPTTLVTGTVSGGEGHAWNLVSVDSNYYYVDTTWGDVSYQMAEDSGIDEDSIPAITYDYLCVSTDQLVKTHTITPLVTLPRCVAIDANYYVMEGAYFTSYEEAKLSELFKRSYESGRSDVTIKCSEEAVYQLFLENLLNEQEIFNYIQSDSGRIAYADDVNQLSLTFWLVDNE